MSVWTKEEVEREAWFGGQKERVLATVAEVARLEAELAAAHQVIERNGQVIISASAAELAAERQLAEAVQDAAHAEAERHLATIRERDALRNLLAEAEEWMSSGDATPTDGWGIRIKSADHERHELTARFRAALAAAKEAPK
jgi:isoaspartyl peptidase/L-asparaginase-like protein (Ntn-hydrolase superfamily)